MKLKPPVEVEHDICNTFVAIAGTDYAAAKVFGKDAAERRETAAFIVKACNLHDELVATLRDVLDSLEYVDQVMPTLSGYAVRAARMSTIRAILAKLEAK